MSWTVLVRGKAERDMKEARDWYEEQRRGLGVEFLKELSAAMRWLELNPERQPFYYGHFRRVLLRRFPYKIFYQIVGERVVIFRVLHAKQDHERRFN